MVWFCIKPRVFHAWNHKITSWVTDQIWFRFLAIKPKVYWAWLVSWPPVYPHLANLNTWFTQCSACGKVHNLWLIYILNFLLNDCWWHQVLRRQPLLSKISHRIWNIEDSLYSAVIIENVLIMLSLIVTDFLPDFVALAIHLIFLKITMLRMHQPNAQRRLQSLLPRITNLITIIATVYILQLSSLPDS